MIGTGKNKPFVPSQADRMAQRAKATAKLQARALAAVGSPAAKLARSVLSQLQSQYPGKPLKTISMSQMVSAQQSHAYNLQQANAMAQLQQNQLLSSHIQQMQNQMMASMYQGSTTSGLWNQPSSGTSTCVPLSGGSVTSAVSTSTAGTALTANTLYAAMDQARGHLQQARVPSAYEIGGYVETALRNGYAIRDGQAVEIYLPGGGILNVKRDGSHVICDKNAKVTYRANPIRDFNRFFNAAERMEEFIGYCGTFGVTKEEMLDLPVSLFISWLVVQAARSDGEHKPPEAKVLPRELRARARPGCVACGAALSPKHRAKRIEFCGPECFSMHFSSAMPGAKPLPPKQAIIGGLVVSPPIRRSLPVVMADAP